MFTEKKNRGFTLIELSIVLFIIVLLMGIIIPNFSIFKEEKLKSTARKLAGFIKGIRTESMFSTNPFRLYVNFDEKTIEGEICLYIGEGVCEWQKMKSKGAKFTIPDEITLEDITVYGDKVSTGELLVPFTGTGAIPPLTFHLRSGEKQMTVFVNPVTGKTKVEEGYVETVKYQQEE